MTLEALLCKKHLESARASVLGTLESSLGLTQAKVSLRPGWNALNAALRPRIRCERGSSIQCDMQSWCSST